MPRKTKEQNDVIEDVAKKTTKKKTSNSKSVSSTKNATTKKTTKSTSTKKSTAKTTKSTTAKSKVATTKRATKSTTAKTSSKKTTVSKSKRTTRKGIAQPVEYYDLPYRYNQTIVRVLSQTPTNLFIYWDISDEDRENYKKIYGENFFEETKPVLIVYNNTLDYNFEVEINDFANSWYLHVNDSKCDYRVELGRRPITHDNKINTDYIFISTSNEIESPNDRILFNNNEHMVYFRDTKTNTEFGKTISFIRNMGKIYNIYDFYKTIYKDENITDNTSSNFK